MKEAFTYAGPKVDVVDSPIPTPEPRQIIVKVICAGLNPKDWKVADGAIPGVTYSNEGDDFAGFVHQIGQQVTEFKVGDRVGCFHKTLSPGRGWAEYAVSWESMAFHLADHVSFEEAATVPLAAITACLGLYHRLPLPYPWDALDKARPLIIWGAASAVGAYAVKLASLTNLHPILAVAGRGAQFVETLIDRSCGDTIIDYRQGNDNVVAALKLALGDQKPEFAFDATSENGTDLTICRVINQTTGKIAVVHLDSPADLIPGNISRINTAVETSQLDVDKVFKLQDSKQQGLGITQFATVMLKFLGRGLNEGWFTPHPYVVIPGGFYGLENALNILKSGSVSAKKLIIRVTDTDGLQ
ncbi:chaperonin 10-like protein [Xylogone sp. PMI_703]|nr:chaperonin 10-like protein [Xylogone sp. PMI_703]